MKSEQAGVVAMVAACTIWGLSPLYYRPLAEVPTAEVLAHRTLWSLAIFAAILGVWGRLGELRAALSTRRSAGLSFLAAALISTNWFLFIYSVQINRVSEAALGYYIFPLVAVLLGVATFGERLDRLQWLAVALAALAVAILTWATGVAPWISLVIATTFGLYGLIKKRLATGPVVSVTAEVLLLSPIAIGYLAWQYGATGVRVFATDPTVTAVMVGSGVVTAVPLILFSRAAQRVRLATVGLIQYLNPTLQFLCAVLLFGEPLGPVDFAVFGLIWLALALYSAAVWGGGRARRSAAIAAAADSQD